MLFIEQRDKTVDYLISKGMKDISDEYQGSLILTKIQMALTLSKCSFKEFYVLYKKYKIYSLSANILNAYRNLSLKDASFKYKCVLFLAKYNFDLILFLICFIINKCSIHIYPN